LLFIEGAAAAKVRWGSHYSGCTANAAVHGTLLFYETCADMCAGSDKGKARSF
jgi:hypothetical protein